MSSLFIALLRGINVGGNNRIAMADLRACVEATGAADVATYIQSGNVLFDGGPTSGATWRSRFEMALSERFGYAATVVVRSHAQLQATVKGAPRGYGDEPDAYLYDVLFLVEPLTADEVVATVPVREEVDEIAAGDGVVYHRRLAARATQSRFSKVVGMPIYKSMTIRNWRTTTKLLGMLDERTG